MSVVSIGGTRFGTRSGALFLEGGKSIAEAMQSPGKYAAPRPGYEERLGDVAMWGSNNLLPQEMASDIEDTGVLSSGTDGKARIIIGKGPTVCTVAGRDENGLEQLAFVNNSEVSGWLEENRAFENSYAGAKDLLQLGTAFFQLLLSVDRKTIVGYKRIDAAKCRFSRIDDKTGKSEYVYISADWMRWYSVEGMSAEDKAAPHIERVPLLDKDYPLQDLQSRSSGFTFMMAVQYPLTNKNYYPPSPWYAARRWVKIAQGIPEMKAAMFKNQMTIKYIVEIHPKFWEVYDPRYKTAITDAQKKIQDDFYAGIDEYLTGGNNAYKSIFSTTIDVMTSSGYQSVPGIKITSIEDHIKDGKLGPDSAAANSEILFTLMINPALIGADSPGGPYSGGAGSGSNIREALLMQIMLGELERKYISQPLVVVLSYNGWKGAGEVIRYPNSVLTTLNTGANTKPVV